MSVKQMTTIEQLWDMPEKPGLRFELSEGELIEVSGAGVVDGRIVKFLLRPFLTAKSLGTA